MARMQKIDVVEIHKDLVTLKRDIRVIKHILSEEGRLTEEAKKRLDDARKTPNSKYEEL